jgi:outer membrane murein-binding lipoprotein Lpp
MLTRTIVLFSFGVAAVLFGVSQTDAQPGKGFGKGPGAGADVKKLQSDLERLLEQVEATKAQLARAKEGTGGKKGGFEGKAKFEGKSKKGFEKGKGKGGFEGKKGDMKKEFGKGKGGDFKKKFEPMKEFAKKSFEGKKLDPDTIKQRYEFYKKLYDELPRETRKGKGFEAKGKGGPGPKRYEDRKKKTEAAPGPMPPIPFKGGAGKGPMGAGSSGGSVEARIDRLIRELEQLRSEVRGGKKK